MIIRLDELTEILLSVWFFEKIVVELTMLNDSQRAIAVLLFHLGRACFVLAMGCSFVRALKMGTFLRKRTWLVLAVGALSALNGAQSWMVEIALLVVCLRGMDVDRMLRKAYRVLLLGTCLIVLLNLLGIISGGGYVRSSGAVRRALGFYHPNVLGMRIFQICAMHLYFRSEKGFRLWDILLCFLGCLFTAEVTDSRTATVLLAGLGLLTIGVVAARTEQRRRKARPLAVSMFRRGSFVAILLPVIAVFGFLWLGSHSRVPWIESTVWSRMTQTVLYFRRYGLSIHGRELYYAGKTVLTGHGRLVTLDNGYMYLLLGFGVPAFVLFMAGQIRLIARTAAGKNWMLLGILLFYMAYMAMETSPLRVDCNFFLLFLTNVLWERKNTNTTAEVLEGRAGYERCS